MKIVYRGAFGVPWTTETHVSKSMELLGHTVHRLPEDRTSWPATERACEDASLFVWTQTKSYADRWRKRDAEASLVRIGQRIPTVGFHLDRWWGLKREHQVYDEPFFRHLRWVFTADGDNDDRFADAGVRHFWLPPAVFGPEIKRGTLRPELASDVAFVGSWEGGYHEEHWPERKAILDAARERYGARFRCWPERGQPAVRGERLNDLYRSASVVLGDSCFASTSRNQWSDRAPETAGRGGALVFPYIDGLAKQLRPEEHVRYFMPGDHAEMCRQVDWLLDHPSERQAMVERAMTEVKARHCYTHRVETILETVFG